MIRKRMIAVFAVVTFASATSFAQGETMKIKLYFLNQKADPNIENCQDVKPVVRVIPKTLGTARASLEELFKGVNAEEKAKGFVSFTPEETRGILKSVKIKDRAAYVNFNKIVYEQMGVATTSCGGGFFSSIEATLIQFPTIKKVFYAIEGSPRDFYDWVQVGECPDELKNCDARNF